VRSFFYNAAHQLTDVYDRPVSGTLPPSGASHIHYSVDTMDNITGIDVYDGAGARVETHQTQYNSLNQLYQDIGAYAGEISQYQTDGNNNLKQITDPLGHITKFNYDALNRLTQSIDPSTNPTTYTLNALDQLTGVKDPRNLSTTYTPDGLDRVGQIVSPDSGTTNQTAFDGDGNVTTHTDANANTTTDQYDALDRLTLRTRQDGTTVTLTWDQTDVTHGFGIGRLTRVVDSESGITLNFKYDAWGRIIQRKETIGSVVLATSWAYDTTTGQMQSLTLPSTAVVGYTWSNGLPTALTLNGAALVSNIVYFPFNGPTQWTLANGETDSRDYDLDGRIASDPVESIGYDTASRVTGWTLATTALSGSVGFDYKANTDFVNSYTFGSATRAYGYDASGNRTLQNAGGTNTVFTIDPNSNRIASSKKGILASQAYLYDADGSRTGIKTVGVTYDTSERVIANGNGTYAYDGLGERIKKKVGLITTLFAYDTQGHLIGEYNGSGNSPLETIYLGDMPVALNSNGATAYIHADYRNTPRQIDNASQQAIWLWNPQPFGDNLPNNNPSGLGNFVYNLRFPGQYYDAETGNNYNYFRDYDSATGRYLESDPIGLAGGINPYIYANANPLSFVDPTGTSWLGAGIGSALGAGGGFLVGGPAGAYEGAIQGALVGDSVEDFIDALNSQSESNSAIAGAIWTSTRNQSSVENAFSHWQKHGQDFPNCPNAKSYAKTARDFLNNPPNGSLTKVRSNGDTLVYDPATNTFAAGDANGVPRTMFKPTNGMGYWGRQ
jgi:RHS repeat-associated protein